MNHEEPTINQLFRRESTKVGQIKTLEWLKGVIEKALIKEVEELKITREEILLKKR